MHPYRRYRNPSPYSLRYVRCAADVASHGCVWGQFVLALHEQEEGVI